MTTALFAEAIKDGIDTLARGLVKADPTLQAFDLEQVKTAADAYLVSAIQAQVERMMVTDRQRGVIAKHIEAGFLTAEDAQSIKLKDDFSNWLAYSDHTGCPFDSWDVDGKLVRGCPVAGRPAKPTAA